MVKYLFLALLLLIPSNSFSSGGGDPPASSSTICYSFSLSCTSPPCFPWGPDGKSFRGANNQMNITINPTAGAFQIDVEGRNPGATSYIPHSSYTSGADAKFLRNPAELRVVIQSGNAGSGVICGNS